MVPELVQSCKEYVYLVRKNLLNLDREKLGEFYVIQHQGIFTVFRETVSHKKIHEDPITLIVGFRLRFIENNNILHRIFQKLCILTTPFWSGFTGFHSKLWMVDQDTKNYLGIYEWYGVNNAYSYLNILLPILRLVSEHNTVWYKIEEEKLASYLYQREVSVQITPQIVFT